MLVAIAWGIKKSCKIVKDAGEGGRVFFYFYFCVSVCLLVWEGLV